MSRIPLLSLRLPPYSGGQTGYRPNITLKDFGLLDPSNPPTSSSLCLLSRSRCPLKPRKASMVSRQKDLYTHLRSKPPQHHQKILEATNIEQQRGWLGPFRMANDLKDFGAGMWRFIPRFLLQQRLRDRLIDNAGSCVRRAMPRMQCTSFPRVV